MSTYTWICCVFTEFYLPMTLFILLICFTELYAKWKGGLSHISSKTIAGLFFCSCRYLMERRGTRLLKTNFNVYRRYGHLRVYLNKLRQWFFLKEKWNSLFNGIKWMSISCRDVKTIAGLYRWVICEGKSFDMCYDIK